MAENKRQDLEAQLESGLMSPDEFDARMDQLALEESFELPEGDVRSDIFPIISRRDETAEGGRFLDIGTPGFVKDAIVRGGEIVADLRSGKTPDPQTVTETAMDIGTGGLGSSAVTSAGADIAGMGLGMFASATRKPRSYEKAIELMDKGADADTVFKQTGVFPGPDNKLRFEIDDSKAKFEVNVGVIDTGFSKDAVKIAEIYPYHSNPDYKKDLVLGDILDHPELYKYYPEARNIPVTEIPPLSGARGSFKPYDAKGNTEATIALDSNLAYSMEKAKANDAKAKARGTTTKNTIFDELEEKKGVLLHEIQHYVQFVDELGAGGNSSLFLPDNFLDIERTIRERLKPLENKIDSAKKSSVMARLRLKDIYTGKENVDTKHIDAAKEILTPEEFKEFDSLVGMDSALGLMKNQAFEFYKRLGGEVEARFTQGRRDMSSAARAQARPDFSTADSDAEKGLLSVGTAEDVFLDSPDKSKFSPEIQEFLGNAERYADKLSKYLGLDKKDTPDKKTAGLMADELSAVEPMEVGFDEALASGKFLKNYDNTVAADMAERAKTARTGARGETDLLMADVPEGTQVGVRINLNSKIDGMPKGVDKLLTLHKGTYSGKAMSYQPYVVLKDVKFNVSQPGRTGVAANIKGIDTPEAKNKFPMASVDGKYVPNKNLLEGNTDDLVEIGFNPAEYHLYYDLKTGQAVRSAEEAMPIGDRVYARNVEYWKKSEAPEPKPTKSGVDVPSKVRFKEMNTGGLMSDAYNRAES